MIEKSMLTKIADPLMENRDKTIAGYILKLPRRPEAKEKNQASTQRKAIERDLDY